MQNRSGLVLICLLVCLANWLATWQTPQTLIFASNRAGNGDIFALDAWGRLTNLTNSPTADWSPRWNRAGTRLVFTAHTTDQADIWLMNANGSCPTNLSNHPAWDYSPAWSPDGKQVVFVSERDGDAELFIQAIHAVSATQLTHNSYPDKLPDWSPDGQAIAFAAIINGSEQIYRLDLTRTNAITPLLPPTLSGTNPVWSPSGRQMAFVGWHTPNAISLYTLAITNGFVTPHYTDTGWIGSLSWSQDEQWLFFTARPAANHDLLALHLATGRVYRLTNHPAWDDFAVLRPGSAFTPLPRQQITGNRNQHQPLSRRSRFGYGVNLADLSNAYLVQDIGFTALKGYVNWATVEPQPGEYRWVDPDNVLHAAQGAGVAVLLRVQGTPDWARSPQTLNSHPPTNLDDFARFLTVLAARYRGQVIAYEIWNEPNLTYEWGYLPPNPTDYTAMLKTACHAIKTADPAALVISAGLAPTGNGNPPESLGDLDFLSGMYRAGAKGFFDALGSHLYTTGQPPDFEDSAGITFNRVQQQREIMLAFGDSATPVWITEMGWALHTHWDLGQYHNQGVSQQQQADYLVRAYQKIQTDWDWVQAAYLFNLDFSLAPWYPAGEQMRWYAILNPDRTPRPAYTALQTRSRE